MRSNWRSRAAVSSAGRPAGRSAVRGQPAYPVLIRPPPLSEMRCSPVHIMGYTMGKPRGGSREGSTAEPVYYEPVTTTGWRSSACRPGGAERMKAAESALSGWGQCEEIRAAAHEQEQNGHCVTLSTLHAAKGLEFDTVVFAGFDTERMPHPRSVNETDNPAAAIEEERRLARRPRGRPASMRRAQSEGARRVGRRPSHRLRPRGRQAAPDRAARTEPQGRHERAGARRPVNIRRTQALEIVERVAYPILQGFELIPSF